jgi:hypothetical protein
MRVRTINCARLGWCAAFLTVLLTVPLGGCRALAVMFGEKQTRKVPAKWPHLIDKKVCILVRADWEILFEHSQVQLEVADHVALALESCVEGVTVVPPQKVVDYQRRFSEWEREDPAQIGRRFEADRVLEIDLTQYTTREPDSPHLYRGHIAAVVNVYNVAYPDSEAAFSSEVRTSYPSNSPGAWGTSEREIRRATLEVFAQDAAGLFYDREVEVE